MLNHFVGFTKKPGTSTTNGANVIYINNLRNLAFENSVHPNIISAASTGQILVVNKAACLLLGYSKNDLLTKSKSDIFDVSEVSFKNMLKTRTETGWSASLATLIKKDGERFHCEIASAVFKGDEDFDKAITTITNRNLSAEYKHSFRCIFTPSSDIFYDFDLLSGMIIVSDAYEREFGYKTTGHMITIKQWLSHIHPEDKNKISRAFLKMIKSQDAIWSSEYRFLKSSKSVVSVCSKGIVLRHPDGKAYRMVGYMHDQNEQKLLQERLQKEIHLKEQQIAEATEKAKEAERSQIGKELHDNVNQLLGVSNLYLNMAKRQPANNKNFLTMCSRYTLTAIEEIRKLSRGLTSDSIKIIGLQQAISTMVKDTMEASRLKIDCRVDQSIEYCVDDNFKLNLLRIIQAQMNNILIHSKATKTSIAIIKTKKQILLTITDNGIGFDTRKKGKGIGITNINRRAEAYFGTASITSEQGKGCKLNVEFPLKDQICTDAA